MPRTIRTKLVPLSFLAGFLALAALAPVASAGPCANPGYQSQLYQSGNVDVPNKGLYWDSHPTPQPDPHAAGDSYNVALWTYNYEVGSFCLAGVSYVLGNGPTQDCPPPGEVPLSGPIPVLSAFHGVYFKPDGNLYAGGHNQDYTLVGDNGRLGDRCFVAAHHETGAEYEWEECITCVLP